MDFEGYSAQVFPVGRLSTGYRGSYNDAQDAELYLALVRQEASKAPKVLRATIVIDESDEIQPAQAPARDDLPSSIWREAFVARFRQTRWLARSGSYGLDLPDHYLPLPDLQDESGWRAYIQGKSTTSNAASRLSQEEIAHSPAYQSKDAPLAMLHWLDQTTATALLGYIDGWLQEALDRQVFGPSTAIVPSAVRKRKASTSTTPASPGKTTNKTIFGPLWHQWTMLCFLKLDELQDSSTIGQFRGLARTCLTLITTLSRDGIDTIDALDQIAAAWQVVLIVASIWGQQDLLLS